ncbi:MAG: SusC/RagA family TonB-linked outer membrane protein [Paludibacter sp.]
MRKITIYKRVITIFILAIFALPLVIWSQNTNGKKTTITFNSTVKDKNGNPISGAKIYGNQGAIEILTNEKGEFSIKVNTDSYILIEAGGYVSVTIPSIASTSSIILKQNEYLMGSDDNLSLAFKSVKRGLSVGNITEIKVPEILKIDNVTRFQSLLDSYGAGTKGGYNLLGLGDALVIVDGLPRDASNLQPEEIEDITILKDVNSALLYGSQAKNGVIKIKTKRGEANKKIIRTSIETGVNTPVVLPKYLNSQNYMTLYNEAQTNDDPNKVPDYKEIPYYDGSNPFRYPDVDYYSKDFVKPYSNTTRFIGEFSGGNNVASYYANMGWEHSDVLYKANNNQNNGSDRLRLRGNVDFNVTDHIKSYIDAAFTFNTSTGLRTDFFSMASTFRPNDYSPLLPVEAFEDPTLIDPLIHVNGNNILGGNSLISKNSYGKNIYGEFNLAGYSRNYNNNMQFNTGIIFDLEDLTKGLTLRADVSFDTYASYAESIQNTYALYEPVWNNVTGKISSINTINSDSRTGVLTLSSGAQQRTIGTNILLDYDRTFNKSHHIASSLLAYYSTATVQGSVHADRSAHLGFRLAYDYKNCYIVDFTGALINSVKLAPGHRLSFSPSLGLGWVISNDKFWTANKIVDYIKVKASAGILQTDASDNFGYNQFKEIYSPSYSLATGDVGGYSFPSTFVAQTANYNLGLEKMKNLNAGFEAAFFDKSLFLDANYFLTHYADIITQRLNYYPGMISTFIPYENYNETSYTGLDVSLKYQKNFGKLHFSAGLNVLYSISEYVKRDEIHNNAYQYLVGKPTDTFWGLKNLGFFSTDAEALAANQRFGAIRRGDIKYADMDGNGSIDDNDKTAIGNSSPRIMGDLNLSIGYQGFSLFVTASTRLGYNWMMSTTESPNSYFWVDGSKKYSEIVLNRWTDATAATATYPRLTAQTSQNNFRTSDFWMVNGNDLTISRVQLNYEVPSKLFKNIFIKSLSAYVRGNNLLMLAQDAQLRQTNVNVSTRNFALGLKISY